METVKITLFSEPATSVAPKNEERQSPPTVNRYGRRGPVICLLWPYGYIDVTSRPVNK